MAPKQSVGMAALGILAAGILVGVVLAGRPPSPSVNRSTILRIGATAEGNGQEPVTGQANESRDLGVLLAIITGVALGVAGTALPSLMFPSAASGYWLASAWLLWCTGVAAVILTYLSTLTGAKLLLNEIDLAHTASLIMVFLAECAMFAAVGHVNSAGWFVGWIWSFATFSAAAILAISLVIWKLPAWWRSANGELAIYRRQQLTDVAFASMTMLVPILYLYTSPSPTAVNSFIVSIVALASIAGACLKQYRGRRHWRRLGLI